MKILILGKSGQVATALQQINQIGGPFGSSEKFDIEVWGSDIADFLCPEKWAWKLKGGDWDAIINTGAYTKVDLAETERVNCEQINAEALREICRQIRESKKLFVHYSTDYVYSGEGDLPWVETDKTSPLSWYGETKLRGEKIVQQELENFLIFRTSWVYSPWGSNFVKTMLKLLSSRDELKIVSDQVGSPTSAINIARYTFDCVRKFENRKSGIYHLTDDGYASWFDFTKEIEKQASDLGMKIQAKKIVGISTSDYKTAAVRPLNSRLNKAKICEEYGADLINWKIALGEVFKTPEIKNLLENISNKNI